MERHDLSVARERRKRRVQMGAGGGSRSLLRVRMVRGGGGR